MDQRGVLKEGKTRVVLAVLFVVLTGAQAFLVPAAPLLEQKQNKHVSLQYQPTSPRDPMCIRKACSTRYRMGVSLPEGLAQHQHQQQGRATGARGGKFAATLLPVDAGAVTRTEALTRFFAASLAAFPATAVVAGAVAGAAAPETKAPQAADRLGVIDDLLAACPSTPTCVSSQDDRPYPFMEPWAYDGSFERSMSRLRAYLELSGAQVIASSPRYLRVEFQSAAAAFMPASVDDAEFYFTPGDALVQFRCARRNGPTDFGASRRRMDSIRIAMKFESIPVLRNRKRTLFFGESPIDSFGPSFGEVDPSVIYGDMDPMSPPFETPSGDLRERYGGGGGGGNRPAWWGKPLAEAGGFADWRQSPSAPPAKA